MSSAQLGNLKSRDLINEELTNYFVKRLYLEVAFYIFTKKRHRTGSFRMSLLSCVTQIIRRSI